MLSLVWTFLQPIVAPFLVGLLAVILRAFEKKILKNEVASVESSIKQAQGVSQNPNTQAHLDNAMTSINVLNKKLGAGTINGKSAMLFIPLFIAGLFMAGVNEGQCQTNNVRSNISSVFPYSSLTTYSSGDTLQITPVKSGLFINVGTIGAGDTLVISMRDTVAGVIKNVRRNNYINDVITVAANFTDVSSRIVFDGIYWKAKTLTTIGVTGYQVIRWTFNGTYWMQDNTTGSTVTGGGPQIYNSYFGGDSIPTGYYLQYVDSIAQPAATRLGTSALTDSVIGKNQPYLLGRPQKWVTVRVAGVNYKVPAY